MVSSFFPGRIRLRADVLKDPLIASKACDLVRSHRAVTRVESNVRTGSLLIEYNAQVISSQKLESVKPHLLALQKSAAHYTKEKQAEVLAALDAFAKIVALL